MAMRTGEMMVIIRAQDFASRTLRRVGGEFAHLSREQQKAFRKQQLAWQKYDADASSAAAHESRRQLRLAEGYRMTTRALARNVVQREKLLDRLATAQRRVDQLGRATVTFGPAGMVNPQALQALNRGRQQVARLKQEIVNLDKAAEPLQTRANRLSQVLSQYPSWVRRAATTTQGFRDGIGRVNRELELAHRNLTQAQQAQIAWDQAMRRMPINRLREVSHIMGGIGRTMQLFGAVSTVALGAAANSAANFNTEISLAATQARDLSAPASQVNQRIDQMTNGFQKNGVEIKGVLDLMNEFPATQNEMAASAFDVFSSMNLMTNGVTDVAEGMDLLATANKIAVAGGEDLEIATNAMITVFNNFNPALDNTSETLDTMFDIIRFGRMRLGDFNTMMNKVAPAAAGAGLSLRDVGGAMAFLTEVMPSQRMVATGISRMIEALNNEDVVKGLDMMGVKVRRASGKLKPLDEIFKQLASRFPKLAAGEQTAEAWFKMISRLGRGGGIGIKFTMEGRKALTQIMTHLQQYQERQAQIDSNVGEFAKAHAAQMQSLGIQWKIFLNRIRAVAISIGTDAIPVFQELGQVLAKFLEWWQSLNPETRQFIVRMAVMASVATLVAGAILAVSAALGGVIAMFGGFAINAGGALAMLTKIGKALGFMSALAAISLIINVKRKGDASAWDFLMGALTGAAAGFAVGGPWGALAGGIIVPVTMAIMEDTDWREELAQYFEASTRQQHPAARAYGKYLAGQIRAGLEDSADTQEEFFDTYKALQMRDKLEGNRVAVHNAATNAAKKTAAATKNNSNTQAEYNKQLDIFQKKMEKHAEKMKQYKNDMRAHERAVKEYNQNLVRETVRAQEEAVDNLRRMYMELEQINENLMGELFQGPLLGGEAFDLAKEWGITASIDSMIKDTNQAVARFRKIQSGLAKLRKKGMPIEIIQEIQSMAPEDALGMIQGILKGTPKQQAALITAFKARNKAVQEQTKMDFVDEIERFRRAGVSMGEAIKSGFKDAEVGAWFDSWVRAKFPSVISAAVNQAVNDWRKLNPVPVAPKVPVAPVAPTTAANPGVTGTAGSNNSYDNSVTNINVYMGDSARTASEKREDERRLGFIVRNATQYRGRQIGNGTNPSGNPGRGRTFPEKG